MGIYDNSAKNETEVIKTEKSKKAKKTKSKKKKIISAVIAVILVVVLVGTGLFALKSKKKGASYSFVRTTTLSKGTFEDSFSATGTVKSRKTSTVTTSLNYSIKSVLVSAGDTVKNGDVIATLDTSEIESQIEREKKNLSNSSEQAQSSYDSAKSSYDKASKNLETAKSNLSDAKAEYAPAKESYEKAETSIKAYQQSYDKALSAYEKAGAEFVEKQSAYNKAVSDFKKENINKSKLITAAEEYMAATQNYCGGCEVGSYSISDSGSGSSSPMGQSSGSGSSSIQISQTADDICNSVVSKVSDLTGKTISYSTGNNTLLKLSQKLSALTEAKTTCNFYTIESNYSSAKSSYESAEQSVEQAENSLSQANTQLKSAKNQLENASSSDTLETLYEELENCSLKAEQNGTVTSLNATVGSSATSGMGSSAVATISDLNKLKIVITIAEANINSATIGMTCNITSDASDETYTGTLTQIDPVAGDSGSFGAEVTVDSKNTSLKVGMNASVQLLISTKDDVFQVPIDAVGEDDNGEFVYRHTSGEGVDMEFEKVYVETGDTNDYYIEISSDDIEEGDVIRSTADLTQGIETGEKRESDSSGFSLFGSMFGGSGGSMPGNKPSGMPSGGNFSFPSGGSSGGFTPPSGGFNG